MPQNINLLEELHVHPISAFNGKLIIQISASWVLLLILIYIVGLIVGFKYQKTFVKLEAAQRKISEKIIAYNQKVNPIVTKTVTEQETLPLSSTNSYGFYQRLKDLAKSTPNGVWLNEITFSEPGGIIHIKGSTIAASGVPALINSLNKSQGLLNKNLKFIQLQKNLESNNTDFTIGNEVIKYAEANPAEGKNNKK